MEINSLKINSLETKVENLEIDMEYVKTEIQSFNNFENQLKSPVKIFETTENLYNIRLRIYQWGNMEIFTLYTLNVAKEIPRGTLSYSFSFPDGIHGKPIEPIGYMAETSSGQRFTVQVQENGAITIAYVYSDIPVDSQIYFVGSYICQNRFTD